MKKIIFCLAIIIAMSSLEARAFDFASALNFINRASSVEQTSVEAVKTLSDVETRMAAIDSNVQAAFLNIVSELATRKETKNIKNQLKSNNAALNTLISNYASTLATNKENLVKTVNKLSSKEKTALINDISTLTKAGQDYLFLAGDGIKAATAAVKTAQKFNDVATTLMNINKVATELKTRATTVINFANQIKAVAASAGLTVN